MKSSLLIERLTIPNLLRALVVRGRREIYYLDVSPRISTMWQWLETKLGVVALSHQELTKKPYIVYCTILNNLGQALEQGYLEPSLPRNVLCRELHLEGLHESHLRNAVQWRLMSQLSSFAELCVFGEALAAKGSFVTLIPQRNVFLSQALQDGMVSFPRFAINFWWSGAIINLVRAAIQITKDIARPYVMRLRGKGIHRGRAHKSAPRFDEEVIFFPHIGVEYMKLFRKDQFYVWDHNSPLHPSRIAHFSLGDPREQPNHPSYCLKGSHDFYRDNAIPFGDWYDFPGEPDIALVAKVRAALDPAVPRGIRHALSQFCANIAADISSHVKRADSIPAAKIALVGYEMMFPCELSLALSLRGIHTIATQERFIHPFYRIWRFNLNHYLVHGDTIKRFIADNPRLFSIGSAVSVGPVRTDLITSQALDEKYSRLRAGKKLFLALDLVTEEDFHAGRRIMSSNWNITREFLTSLIRLARETQEIHIVIKPKFPNWIRHSAFADLVATIESMENINIEADLEKYPPYLMASWADAGIGLHTSLGDEMLAAGKPFIFYDNMGYPEPFFDYGGYPVIVHQYDELRDRVHAYVREGHFLGDTDFARLRSDFYAVGDQTPRSRIHAFLHALHARLGAEPAGTERTAP